MIKQLLSIALLAATFTVSAQQNLDFETWSDPSTPGSWDAPLSAFMPGSVSQITTGAGQGSSSAQLTTGTCSICPLFGLPSIMPGIVTQSVANTTRPVSMSVLLQANVAANDEAAIIAQVSLWDTSLAQANVIGQAGATIPGGTVISNWQVQTFTFQYLNANTPDSMTIAAISSDSLVMQGATSNPTVGSTISVDAIVFTYPAGVQEVVFMGSKHIAYPNPSSTEINFASKDEKAAKVIVYDVTGRVVSTLSMDNGKASLDLNQFESGMYIYSITDSKNATLFTNKFNVSK